MTLEQFQEAHKIYGNIQFRLNPFVFLSVIVQDVLNNSFFFCSTIVFKRSLTGFYSIYAISVFVENSIIFPGVKKTEKL